MTLNAGSRHSERCAEEFVRPPLVIERIEYDSDPVVAPGVVAVGVTRPDPRRIGVVGAKTEIRVAVVEADSSRTPSMVMALDALGTSWMIAGFAYAPREVPPPKTATINVM